MKARYQHEGWIGSGNCSVCGGTWVTPLAIWTERIAVPRVHSERIPATRRFFACVPCNYAVATLPAGTRVLLAAPDAREVA